MPSTTAYALVETSTGGELLWFAQSSLGFHEAVSNWVRTYASDEIDTGTLATRVQFDNAPGVTAAGLASALVSVRFLDMTIQAVGEVVHVRKDGEVVVTLRYPVELGDAAILAKADAVLTLFQDVNVPVNVRFYGGSVGALGISGGYYEVEVRAPFYAENEPDRPASVAGNADAWNTVANAIRARFKTLVTDAVPVPTAWDNAPNPTSGGVRWCRLAILPGTRRRIETPAGYRTSGVAVASVFVPLEGGDAPAYRVADAVYESFCAASDTGVVFGIPNVRTIGRIGDDAWWQVNIDCPFTAYHTT